MAIIDRYTSYFVASDNQFGFKKKKNLGCRNANYAVRNVIEHFVSNGSTVNVCVLGLSKAFDRMNHYVLYIKLMERKLPTQLLTVLESWLNTCTTCIRWNGRVSHCFSLAAGVRQGVMSPLLFAIFIDTVVVRVKTLNVGCYSNCICCSIFFFTPMIYCYLLLQSLDYGRYYILCENYLNDVDMCINANKSQCIRFRRRYNTHCAPLIITASGGAINWVDCRRYLGVFFTTGCTFKSNFDNAKSCFFRAFNALYSKVG